MTEHPHEDVRRLFDMVLDVPTAQRESVLERECAGDDGLKRRILAMIDAAEDDQFLGDATADENRGQDAVETTAASPRELGEGGFGSVWAAEQREPVKRRVALKIIKLGMDTRQVIARFEAERQALAMMDHPNIAKVLDAGSTETGRPFFVMELVKGVPILEYCDTEKLDTKSRLDLFTKVCHAIQHAHQKGIIHRDIKPTNVLITLHDGVPVPKVIDFGIAKATNQELTSKTIYTEHRQMIGTPAYMSPEQAEMSGLDIDTRSDIYSLGVLLYEMLTGTTPFTQDELASAGFDGMMRMIREVEPHKPSTRLSSLGDTATLTAQQRRSDVQKLGLMLRGDLDWIVMKCLEKDRTRRYETANGLAADLSRHLSDEPVLAGPPSAKYKLAKFVKRNRGQVIAGGVVAAALVLAVVGTSTGMVWALKEKDRADTEATNASLAAAAEMEARRDAQANEQKAIEEAERAERELARATEIKRLITEMIRSVDPDVAQDADTTVLRRILDDVSTRLANGEVEDELVEAELRWVIGDVYRILGMFPQAEQHLPHATAVYVRILGETDPSTLKCVHALGLLYQYQGRYAEAEAKLLEVLDAVRRRKDEEKPYALAMAANLANLYELWGRYPEGEAVCLETLPRMRRVLGEEHENTLNCMYFLSQIYIHQARYAEAEPLCLETLGARLRILGDAHPRTLYSRMALAPRPRGRNHTWDHEQPGDRSATAGSTCRGRGLGEAGSRRLSQHARPGASGHARCDQQPCAHIPCDATLRRGRSALRGASPDPAACPGSRPRVHPGMHDQPGSHVLRHGQVRRISGHV
jgi:tRNA A-37 threonylcarbamoyl transferase component Bud32/tetratricopeptide (TPR) repeat protein